MNRQYVETFLSPDGRPLAQARMVNRILATLRLLLLGLATSLATSLAHAGDFLGQSQLLDALPETTQMLFAIQDVRSTYNELAKSSVCKHLSGEVWKNVMSQQGTSQTGSLLNPRPVLGIDWSDISTVDQQGAIASFRDQEGEGVMLFLAKLGANADKHPFVTSWLKRHSAASLTTSTINSSTILYLVLPTKENPSPACLAIGPEWTCIASQSKALEQWLKSTSTKSFRSAQPPAQLESLSDTSTWYGGEIRFWLSPWPLLSAFAAKNEPKLYQSAKRFGFDGLESLRGAIRPPNDADPSWQVAYELQLAQPLAKGLSLFSFKQGPEIERPNMMRSGMDHWSISYIDIKPWFQGINHVIDQWIDEETPGSFGDLLDSILTDPEGPQIDIRKDLIYRMGPLVINFGATVPSDKRTGQFQRIEVWSCLLQDAKQATEALNKLFDKDDEVKSERIGAYQCWYTVNNESLFVSLSKGESQTISIAAIDDSNLVLSTDTAWFIRLLQDSKQNPATPKEEAPAFDGHFADLGTKPFSFRQQFDLKSWLQPSWTRLPDIANVKAEQQSTDVPSMLVSRMLVPGVSGNEIPRWQDVQQVFGIVSQSMVKTENRLEGKLWIDGTESP
ncbi:MAG: hypothetical protein NTU79_10765 [Planctomycetota bacterium]|nr:hypothetical protein [Planctomycetota bacterium]